MNILLFLIISLLIIITSIAMIYMYKKFILVFFISFILFVIFILTGFSFSKKYKIGEYFVFSRNDKYIEYKNDNNKNIKLLLNNINVNVISQNSSGKNGNSYIIENIKEFGPFYFKQYEIFFIRENN